MEQRPTGTWSATGSRAAVASADAQATAAGMAVAEAGGNAVDVAIATNAAMTVVAPHLCGLGGDLLAVVHAPDHELGVLNASGRAGSGADPDALRAQGAVEMPFRHDVRSVTVPGCVAGWAALHERFATLPLADLLEPARRLAADGFVAGPLLVGSLRRSDPATRENLAHLVEQAEHPGDIVRLPRIAEVLTAIGEHGPAGFYGGPFGEGLIELGGGLYSPADLADVVADWVEPLRLRVFGHDVVTVPPNSQGYLFLAAAALAESIGVPADPTSAEWAHLLIEASAAAGQSRPDDLAEAADGAALVDAIAGRADWFDPHARRARYAGVRDGDTTYLCTADGDGWAVSLIQSNAAGFGSGLVEPNTGINLHNRGMGFNLRAGHPGEFGPGRRPPHTLCPAMVLDDDGDVRVVLGTMGGDGQPQIVLQLLARLLANGMDATAAVDAGRWVLRGAETGFDTWTSDWGVDLEGHAAAAWDEGLAGRGHRTARGRPYDSGFGHAAVIVRGPDGVMHVAADPRTVSGAAAAR